MNNPTQNTSSTDGSQAEDTARQSIAQSTALAVADATDNLRNLNTLSTTAIGVALSQFIETGDPKYASMIAEAQKIVTTGADNFNTVGQKATEVFKAGCS